MSKSASKFPYLPRCSGSHWCNPVAKAVFHRGHASSCPRYIPNAENFCPECGSAIHYEEHATWCPASHECAQCGGKMVGPTPTCVQCGKQVES